MRSKFTTESCWATSRSWPRPVAWRWTIAARIPIAVWSPAPVSARPPMALVGGPSGEPVMLMAPAIAWAIQLKAFVVRVGPGAAEALHRRQDQSGIQARERVPAEAESVQRA